MDVSKISSHYVLFIIVLSLQLQLAEWNWQVKVTILLYFCFKKNVSKVLEVDMQDFAWSIFYKFYQNR